MGHARNYISFDIVRRVLEDYFGYSILYVMNVTDVDDKIIIRARRNYLLARYRAAAADPSTVFADVRAALLAALTKQGSKLAEAQEALAEEQEAMLSVGAPTPTGNSARATERRREDLATNVAQEHLLLRKTEASLAELEAGGLAAGIEAILDLGADALAEALDKEQGATVTDPAIFRAHAARWGLRLEGPRGSVAVAGGRGGRGAPWQEQA